MSNAPSQPTAASLGKRPLPGDGAGGQGTKVPRLDPQRGTDDPGSQSSAEPPLGGRGGHVDLLAVMERQRLQQAARLETREFHKEDILAVIGDDFDTLVAKKSRVVLALKHKVSLAEILGIGIYGPEGSDPAVMCRDAMSEEEKLAYDTWSDGCKLPRLRPNEDKKSGGYDRESSNTRRDRLDALHRMYDAPPGSFDEANVRFFEAEYSPLVPLLTAVVKLIRAERGVTSGKNIDPARFAEYQALKQLRAESASIGGALLRHHKLLTQQSATYDKEIERAMNELGGDFESRKHRVVGKETMMAALGKPLPQAVQLFEQPRGGGRERRAIASSTQLLAGVGDDRPRHSTRVGGPQAVGGSGGGGAHSPVYTPASPRGPGAEGAGDEEGGVEAAVGGVTHMME